MTTTPSTLTVITDGLAYSITVGGASEDTLYTDSTFATAVTWPQTISADTTWYAKPRTKAGRRHIGVKGTAVVDGSSFAISHIGALPATVDAAEGIVAYGAGVSQAVTDLLYEPLFSGDAVAWTGPGTHFLRGTIAEFAGLDYVAQVDHVSGSDFNADKAAGDWVYKSVSQDSLVTVPTGALGTTPTAVKTSAYPAQPGDLVECDTTGGAFTVTLPTAPPDKTVIDVYLENGTTTLTVASGGSDVFGKTGGTNTSTLTTAAQKKRYMYSSALAVWTVYDYFSLTGINALIAAGAPAVAGAHGSLTGTAATSGTGDTALFTSTAYAANSLAVGSVLKIRVAGQASGVGTLTFIVHCGPLGTTSDPAVITSVTTAAQAANAWTDLDAIILIRTTGASGTCIGSILGASKQLGIDNNNVAAATAAIDTTAANKLTVSCATSAGTWTAQLGYASQEV